ncbi:MAG: MoaD/ThiS family protein [Bacillota bacterium]
MKVKVQLFCGMRLVANASIVEMDIPENATVAELLEQLINRYGEPMSKEIKDPISGEYASTIILVNGSILSFEQGMSTVLSEGDTVAFLEVITGG